jgi:hypothetical protein
VVPFGYGDLPGVNPEGAVYDAQVEAVFLKGGSTERIF